MPRLKHVSYDTPFEDVDLAESSQIIRELLSKRCQPPAQIYLLHTMMPGWEICVRIRIIYQDGSDRCGFIAVRDAEVLKGRWKERVAWLTKWTPSPLAPNLAKSAKPAKSAQLPN